MNKFRIRRFVVFLILGAVLLLSPVVVSGSYVYAGTSQKQLDPDKGSSGGETEDEATEEEGETEDEATDEGDDESKSIRVPPGQLGCMAGTGPGTDELCMPCDPGLPGTESEPDKCIPPGGEDLQSMLKNTTAVMSKTEKSELIKSLTSGDVKEVTKSLSTLCDALANSKSTNLTASDCNKTMQIFEGLNPWCALNALSCAIILIAADRIYQPMEDKTLCGFLYGFDTPGQAKCIKDLA